MPEIEYVLELPVDRAKIVSDELIRLGVPNDRIKVVEPGRSKSPPPPPAMNSVYSKDKQPSKSEKTKPNDSAGVGDGGRQRQRVVRFLPKSIKLGTWCRGQYNVSIHRRAVPEGREFVCITMAVVKEAAADKADGEANALERKNGTVRFVTAAAAANHDGSSGDDKNGVPIIVRQCHCAGAMCDDYRNALLKYLEMDRYGDDEHEQLVKCVYERIADVLSKVNAVNDSARAYGNRGGHTSGGDDDRVESTLIGKTSDNTDEDDGDNIDRSIVRLMSGGSVGEPCSESDVGHSLEPINVDSGNCDEIGLQIPDNTCHQQIFPPSRELRCFDDSANDFLTNSQLRHHSGDRSTTTLELSQTDITRNEPIEKSCPAEMTAASEICVNWTKKRFLDRLLRRGINRSRNDVYQPTNNDATVTSRDKAATVVGNKAKRRVDSGR